jgi:EAL domain-containing protein (putative c-di-GMP-specific phosphodiesterase class I)
VTDDEAGRWLLWSKADDVSPQVMLRTPLWHREWAEQAAEPVAAGRPAAARGEAPPRVDPQAERVRRAVAERDISVEFQPICDIERGQVVGYEALSRGPRGPLNAPDRIFAAAAEAGVAGQLDWICRAEAFRLMLAQRLPPVVSLFVNVEPDSLIEPCPADLLSTIWTGTSQLRIFVDLRGATLGRYPFEILETVRRARAAGWGVAVGDLGSCAGGLALLPTLEPDVLKVDAALVTDLSPAAGGTIAAVLAEAEHTGAAVLIDRVEDEPARRLAPALGARFHSGHLLGSPGPLPKKLPVPRVPVPLRGPLPPLDETPWELVSGPGTHLVTGVLPADVDHLVRIFATQAAAAGQPPVIAAVLPAGAELGAEKLEQYRRLLERCPLIVVLGHQLAGLAGWRARLGKLPADSPLQDQFYFAALSPTLSLLVAGRREPGSEQTVTMAVSQRSAICRQVVRYITATMDTLAGGVRDALLG